MSDLFGAPPAPAPVPPPARRARAPGEGGASTCSAGAGQQAGRGTAGGAGQQAGPQTQSLPTCAKSQASAPGPTSAPEKINIAGRQYGLVTLHDGRQVDSGSVEWKLECLASTLLQLGGAERDAWIRGYGTPAAQVELRLLVSAIEAARRGRKGTK